MDGHIHHCVEVLAFIGCAGFVYIRENQRQVETVALVVGFEDGALLRDGAVLGGPTRVAQVGLDRGTRMKFRMWRCVI